MQVNSLTRTSTDLVGQWKRRDSVKEHSQEATLPEVDVPRARRLLTHPGHDGIAACFYDAEKYASGQAPRC